MLSSIDVPGRRALICAAATSLAVQPPSICAAATSLTVQPPSARAHYPSSLSQRFFGQLTLPSMSMHSSVRGDLRYPDWLAGSWRVSNSNYKPGLTLPLGERFVDPFLLDQVRSSETRQYEMRFAVDTGGLCGPSDDGSGLRVRQDRRFNAIQEENAFNAPAGFLAQRGTFKCDASRPHGIVRLDVLDTMREPAIESVTPMFSSGRPLPLEIVRKQAFRSTSELEIVWAASEATDDAFVTSELLVQRSLLPPADEVLATAYLELLWKFELPAAPEVSTAVRARYRVAQYLGFPGIEASRRREQLSKAQRALEREAAGRAVALLDYDVVLEKMPT